MEGLIFGILRLLCSLMCNANIAKKALRLERGGGAPSFPATTCHSPFPDLARHIFA